MRTLAVVVLAGLLIGIVWQHYQIGSLKAGASEKDLTIATLNASLVGEREAAQQAVDLATAVRESDERLLQVAARLQVAINKLGEQHAKADPCFYMEPDGSTINGLFSEEANGNPPYSSPSSRPHLGSDLGTNPPRL